ncbi:hypothetical protein WH47_03199 [Habropoda laboriosa]|uniref:Uncharacterized protein n=1 Tax=Habropoda laboriosa TaxID=597456 RepID=A0A0L7RBB7_9HYME|nr:PREDICTED: uncharacterized protein LOC108580195 [Habropoda laboriosa]KOC68041.1 hypothetical protein WH47_03199 [Habropoda laboriosa]
MKTILIAISCALLLVTGASNISEECKIHEMTTISCRCTGNEEFFLPEGYNYENVTSLRIASCTFANLHFSSLTEANRITEIIVQNISERLIFELFLTSKKMKRVKLSKIGRIPLITHDTFVNLNSIETFRIEDTRIDHFQERFTDLAITDLTMINVTIERIDQLNLSEKGETLRIENSQFQNVTGSLNFAYFSNMEILRSTFQLQKPGYVVIEGDLVFIENSVFSNASVNVVAANGITINGTCADGSSSMRLSSNNINSANNRLPTEIIYTKNKYGTERFFNRNNTVCIAGNCKCPKSGAENFQFTNYFPTFPFQLLLPTVILLSIYS